MAREIIPHRIYDWSVIDKREALWSLLDLSEPNKNLGIHSYNGEIWSSGFVGVGRVYDKSGRTIQSDGKEHIIIIKSRYGMDPWEMLEAVMTDDEYEAYSEELESSGKILFQVFYGQHLVRLAQESQNDGDILYALSFVTSCFNLCKKGLKKSMIYQEENYTSKVRGKINVKQNIRHNTSKGRNDRFYCKYIDFTEDNIENRIIKATLIKCKKIIGQRFKESSEISMHLAYCINALRKVKTVRLKNSDFNRVAATGLYMYYKPLLRQARCIYSQKYYSYAAENGRMVTKSVFTIPYMINMETLFEFYARIILKRSIDQTKYELESYSKRIYLQKGATKIEDVERGIHLMPYCIPDIIVKDRFTQKPVFVIDAKYKSNTRSVREDSHQLLSYVLLTGVNKCGFVFPGETTKVKTMVTNSVSDSLPLNAPSLQYYELILGNTPDKDEINRLFA